MEQKTADAKTVDGFRNFAMRLGISAPGEEGSEESLLSNGQFRFNLITRNRIQLEAAYRGSWIVGKVVDCRAEDMTKAGIIITTSDGADKLQEFKVQQQRLQILQSMCEAIKWGRLYGGCIGVLQIAGQDLESPLDPDTIGEGQFKGIAVYDRWQLNPVLSQVITMGPHIGLPAYYDIVIGSNLNDPMQVLGQGSMTVAPQEQANPIQPQAGENTVGEMTGQIGAPSSYGRVRVHHTRMFRMGGYKLPFFQAITELMWDESIIERLWDRLIEFETVTASAGSLVSRALLRTVGIEGYRQIVAAGGPAFDGLVGAFDFMRQMQQNEGITLLDKNDMFQTYAYTFSGLSDLLARFQEQLSGACDTPLVRMFGQSPGGLNSSGDADMRNYYDSVAAAQITHLQDPMDLIIKVLWRSTFGKARPDDLSFIFTPLWQMSDKEKAEIAANKTTAIISAHQDGLVKTSIAMKELKQMASDTGVWGNITDEDIDEAELEAPPSPDMPDDVENPEPNEPSIPGREPGGDPSQPKEVGINVKDSMWKKLKKMFVRDRQHLPDFEKHVLAVIRAQKQMGTERKLTKDQRAIHAFVKKGK